MKQTTEKTMSKAFPGHELIGQTAATSVGYGCSGAVGVIVGVEYPYRDQPDEPLFELDSLFGDGRFYATPGQLITVQ